MSPLRREKKLFMQMYSANSNLMDPVNFPNEKQTKRARHAVQQDSDTGEHEAAGWI